MKFLLELNYLKLSKYSLNKSLIDCKSEKISCNLYKEFNTHKTATPMKPSQHVLNSNPLNLSYLFCEQFAHLVASFNSSVKQIKNVLKNYKKLQVKPIKVNYKEIRRKTDNLHQEPKKSYELI